MEKKTKQELLNLIKDKEKEIVVLKEQAKKADMYAQFDESARDIRALYDSLVGVGFSDDQAFAFVNTAMANAAGNPNIFR